jgi:hypothetical protein
MALRVTQTTARALEIQGKRQAARAVSGARFFSDAKTPEEEAAAKLAAEKEDALMARLKEQVLEDSQRTGMQGHN